MPNQLVCKICGGRAHTSGSLKTENSQNIFDFARCVECGFGWVLNPRTDFENIYNHKYYIGEGVDPVVKFLYEVKPESSHYGDFYKKLRYFEYDGWLQVIKNIRSDLGKEFAEDFRVLDFGGGLGGLTTYLNAKGIATDLFDVGYGFEQAKLRGVPTTAHVLDQNEKYDLIISLQVIEHFVEPNEAFAMMSSFLKNNGILIADTGNLDSHKGEISKWFYAQHPEVHVSFWTPKSLAVIGKSHGMTPKKFKYDARIIQYKILHNLHFNKKLILTLMRIHRLWKFFIPVVDWKYKISKIGYLVKSSYDKTG